MSLLVLLIGAKDLYSQKADSIILNNAALYYYTYGKGEPLIILSGGPGIAAHQEDDVAIKLSKTYQAILFDQRGTGKSWTRPLDSSTINVDRAIEDLELLRQHLHINKLNLYGHSWGSMLAAGYISNYPEHVKLFISVCGGELDGELTESINDNVNAKVQKESLAKMDYWRSPTVLRKDSAKAAFELRRLKVARSIYDTTKIDLVMQQVEYGKRSFAMSALMWRSLQKNLHFIQGDKRYKGKALIIFGWNDMISLTTVTQYLEAFPKATIKGIFKSGHYPEIEQPEAFYSVLLNYLDKNLIPAN